MVAEGAAEVGEAVEAVVEGDLSDEAGAEGGCDERASAFFEAATLDVLSDGFGLGRKKVV